MTRGILTQREFHSIAAQLGPAGRRDLVARIEAAFRRAIDVENVTDDAIVVATLDTEGRTAFERAGLAVVRACIAFRESPEIDRALWLDRLGLAVADAEPVRLAGIMWTEGRARGTARGASRVTKKGRAELEKLMRNCLAKGEDASHHFADWAKQHGYSTRQLRNIWKVVQGAGGM